MRRNEHISTIMTNAPVSCHHGQKLSEVRKKMTETNCHHMPVVSGKKLIGMISSTDLLRASYDGSEGETVLDHTRTVEDVMQPGLVTITPKTTVREATTIFAKNWFHALPVVEGDALVGIVTTTDVFEYLLEQY